MLQPGGGGACWWKLCWEEGSFPLIPTWLRVGIVGLCREQVLKLTNMLTLWKSRGVFLGWETQRRCGEPTAVELHPAEAPAQKLRHRMSFSLMLIYIALNLAVILTEKHVTEAGQVGFNHQSVTHISFSQVGTKKPKPQKSLRDGETLSSLWRNNCRGGSEGMLPWQLNPHSLLWKKKKKKGGDDWQSQRHEERQPSLSATETLRSCDGLQLVGTSGWKIHPHP